MGIGWLVVSNCFCLHDLSFLGFILLFFFHYYYYFVIVKLLLSQFMDFLPFTFLFSPQLAAGWGRGVNEQLCGV